MRADSRGGKEKDSPEESGGKLELGSETGSGLQESAAPHNTPVARRRSLASRTVAPASALLRYRESTAEKRASVRVVSALLDRTTPNPVTVFYLESKFFTFCTLNWSQFAHFVYFFFNVVCGGGHLFFL